MNAIDRLNTGKDLPPTLVRISRTSNQTNLYQDLFDQIENLEKQVQFLQDERRRLPNLDRQEIDFLVTRIRVFRTLLQTDNRLSIGESLSGKDYQHLWELLFETLLELIDRSSEAYPGDLLPPEKEAKALHILYAVSVFVNREHRYPAKRDMSELLDDKSDLASKESIIANFRNLTPQGRSQKARQREQGERGSVGSNTGDWSEGDDELQASKEARRKSIPYKRRMGLRAYADRYPISEEHYMILFLLENRNRKAAAAALLQMPIGKELRDLVCKEETKPRKRKKPKKSKKSKALNPQKIVPKKSKPKKKQNPIPPSVPKALSKQKSFENSGWVDTPRNRTRWQNLQKEKEGGTMNVPRF